ncbi:MAG: hypothetical protein WBL11_07760 [Bacteroidales bacterium]|mgnify:FL=1|jgi:hypothetical protein|nr:hypothetical protein [Bacteroidales bacterium]MDI9576213.1 hypothetical protein [Bacteroidota bacterium]MDD3756172.1 hypothetical protein [Bacteroidales bacterium]MDY0401210.1 hypothetical protein [Bacteroidales bacterium]HHW58827.1 hypothetical protein [Bacteroidales bacterium]
MKTIEPLYFNKIIHLAKLDDYLSRFFEQNNLPDEIYPNIYLAILETSKFLIMNITNEEDFKPIKLEVFFDNGILFSNISTNLLSELRMSFQLNKSDDESIMLIKNLCSSCQIKDNDTLQLTFAIDKLINEFEQIKDDEMQIYKKLKK